MAVEMFEKLKNWPLYPILFSLYPILFLLGNNASEVRPNESIRAIVLVLLCTLLLLALFRMIMSGWEAASLMATIVVVMLLSYGHLYRSLRDLMPGGSQIIRHRFIFPAIIILLILILWIIRRNRHKFSAIPQYLNVVSLVLLVIPIFQIAQSEILYQRETSAGIERDSLSCNLSTPAGRTVPDIYYIILDGYAREDVLAETFDYDNEPFLNALRERGFYIADGSQSNYAHTNISLSSSLNMAYHDLHDPDVDEEERKTYQIPSVSHNLIRRELECLGYFSVAIDSGRDWTTWRDADLFLSAREQGTNKLLLSRANAFESMLVYNSAGLIVLDASAIISDTLRAYIDNPQREHQDNVLFALNVLGDSVPMLTSPKIVYAHIISPHRPFFFDPDGEIISVSGPFTLRDLNEGGDKTLERESYLNQVAGINDKVLDMVTAIQENSETPPIIIIHADHGTGDTLKDHMSILMALYLPNDWDAHLYETISPVNIFRLIFNIYFNGEYEILDDRSYYSHWKTRLDFTEIPNTYPDK